MFLLREVVSLIHLAHFLPQCHHIFHVTLHKIKNNIFLARLAEVAKKTCLQISISNHYVAYILCWQDLVGVNVSTTPRPQRVHHP